MKSGGKRQNGKPEAGFTLVEMMVVVLIIGILAALVIGISGYANKKAAEARAQSDLQLLKNALEEYRVEYGQYPLSSVSGTAKDIVAALTPQDITTLTNLVHEIHLEDPWGRDYQYEWKGRYKVIIFSKGPDDKIDTDDDIRINRQTR